MTTTTTLTKATTTTVAHDDAVTVCTDDQLRTIESLEATRVLPVKGYLNDFWWNVDHDYITVSHARQVIGWLEALPVA